VEYKPFLKGTYILTRDEANKFMVKGDGFKSIYGSTKIADEFNVANKVYDKPQAIADYIDASLTK
jgi:NitT/TauT family transport system substrate-binding protein